MKKVMIQHSFQKDISHFTTGEGGHWLDASMLQVGHTQIHALRFTDGTEWDCINGYRTPLTTVEELSKLQKNLCCCDMRKFKENRLITVASRLYASKRYANYVDAVQEAKALINNCMGEAR